MTNNIPAPPYIIFGTITQGGVPRNGVTVIIQNLTKGGSDTRITDASGHYIYDDLSQLPNGYSVGDTIQISSLNKTDTFIVASEPEEKQIDISAGTGNFFAFF